ncbi:NYN domain-containing protein [Arthrobacter sp. AK04]|uniref:NYN domain-containing protein n=1 Tax=Arthrobacter sp. AK04 TaxID=2900048 RepID=UPI001E47D683|nr:NYN domain-containing protein [Arthrobacter sp. AK04]MCD5341432.1 NYN domain-containing protein [Arthrobacter sp. AK04]
MNYEKLIQGILKRTAEHPGLDVLRVYWYDASKDALFTDQHKSIGLLPDVKVRLGRISFNGEQKGVDLKLGLDLVGVARNRAAFTAFLVSGDDDLAEAVEEAQDLGMKVVLVGLDNPDHRLGVQSVAEHLALRVDSIIALPASLIEECFTKYVAEEPRPIPALTVKPPVPVAKAPAPGPRRHGNEYSSPDTEARTEARFVYSSGGYGPDFLPADDNPVDVAFDVGESMAASWYGTVTQGELNDLLADRPILPTDIDRVLLKTASSG